MDEGLLRRIEKATGVDGLAGRLAALPPTDLQSLLLEVYRRLAARATPADVLARYQRSRFAIPSRSSLRALLELDLRALSLLPPGYEPIELSPVTPLGTSSVLAGLSQDWAVAAVRGTEVVSDATNVLALEAALRRRRDRQAPVKMMTSHRLLRGQRYEPPWQQHFRVIALIAAGRGRNFVLDALVEQLEFYRVLLGDVRIALTPLSGGLADAVRLRLPGRVEVDESRSSGRAYYELLCFKIYRGDTEIGDGGFVDWTQQMLSDRRERLLISGIGTERAVEHLQHTPGE